MHQCKIHLNIYRYIFYRYTFQLPDLWKTSKIDAMVWCVTWLAVIILDVDLGLYVGVGFSLLTVAIRPMM